MSKPEDLDEKTPGGVLNLIAALKRAHGNDALNDVDMWGWDHRCAWFERLPLQEAQDYLAVIWTAKKPRIHKALKADYLYYLLWRSPRLDQLFADPRLEGLRKEARL